MRFWNNLLNKFLIKASKDKIHETFSHKIKFIEFHQVVQVILLFLFTLFCMFAHIFNDCEMYLSHRSRLFGAKYSTPIHSFASTGNIDVYIWEKNGSFQILHNFFHFGFAHNNSLMRHVAEKEKACVAPMMTHHRASIQNSAINENSKWSRLKLKL